MKLLPINDRNLLKAEPSLQSQVRAAEEHTCGGTCKRDWFSGSVLTKVAFPEEAGMEKASSSRKTSLEALSSPSRSLSSLSLGYTVTVSLGDGI